jgi:hypothetical protein
MSSAQSNSTLPSEVNGPQGFNLGVGQRRSTTDICCCRMNLFAWQNFVVLGQLASDAKHAQRLEGCIP